MAERFMWACFCGAGAGGFASVREAEESRVGHIAGCLWHNAANRPRPVHVTNRRPWWILWMCIAFMLAAGLAEAVRELEALRAQCAEAPHG